MSSATTTFEPFATRRNRFSADLFVVVSVARINTAKDFPFATIDNLHCVCANIEVKKAKKGSSDSQNGYLNSDAKLNKPEFLRINRNRLWNINSRCECTQPIVDDEFIWAKRQKSNQKLFQLICSATETEEHCTNRQLASAQLSKQSKQPQSEHKMKNELRLSKHPLRAYLANLWTACACAVNRIERQRQRQRRRRQCSRMHFVVVAYLIYARIKKAFVSCSSLVRFDFVLRTIVDRFERIRRRQIHAANKFIAYWIANRFHSLCRIAIVLLASQSVCKWIFLSFLLFSSSLFLRCLGHRCRM